MWLYILFIHIIFPGLSLATSVRYKEGSGESCAASDEPDLHADEMNLIQAHVQLTKRRPGVPHSPPQFPFSLPPRPSPVSPDPPQFLFSLPPSPPPLPTVNPTLCPMADVSGDARTSSELAQLATFQAKVTLGSRCDSETSGRKCIAVMMAGLFADLSESIIKAYHENFLAPLAADAVDIDLFICSEAEMHGSLLQSSPELSSIANNRDLISYYSEAATKPSNANYSKANEFHPSFQFIRLATCYCRFIEPEQSRYSFIVRMRPDFMWYSAPPSVHTWATDSVSARTRDYLGPDIITDENKSFLYQDIRTCNDCCCGSEPIGCTRNCDNNGLSSCHSVDDQFYIVPTNFANVVFSFIPPDNINGMPTENLPPSTSAECQMTKHLMKNKVTFKVIGFRACLVTYNATEMRVPGCGADWEFKSSRFPLLLAPRVAVCLSGQLRTFLDEQVQQGFANNVHRDGYEYFLSVDENVDLEHASLKDFVRAVRVEANPAESITTPCPEGKCMHRYNLPFVSRFVACFEDIENHEKAEGFQYDYFLRMRPDMLVNNPFPHPQDLMPTYGKDIVLFDDQMAMANRQGARDMFLNPVKAYKECYDAKAWSVACHVELLEPVPNFTEPYCCPMNAIAFFGNSTIQSFQFGEGPFAECTVSVLYAQGKSCEAERCERCYWR
eukprot:gnl/MRDRNA2_/MRDRNA2_55096_c0_seq1.p1 gnl/MRDRNA2_/MRDRNA2_55096_c0~~gnl/MRDRNA2_/MRDRNA2_55096_c0_seq1.p1  ORF type:complete len:669 (-),score=67.25 gnl/MRDRNA2_/MRDRNA2_55096_c0_seq1:4-2010(-)